MIQKDLANFADKRFGQNFLKNDIYIQKIIQSMPKDSLRIAEIGPGLGDLTKELIKAKNVTAFEVDKRLCEHLSMLFEKPIYEGGFKLECGDVLERWESGSLLDEPYHLVANLPYYIATNIILKALKDIHCQSILVMVQKEVADKFAARVKQKAFSALSVIAGSVGKAKVCFEVEPQAFVPPPKVTSAVLLIEKEMTRDDEKFEAFLKIAFGQPRKKLMRNLMSAFPQEMVEQTFSKLGLDALLRPHEAETSIYHHLYNELKDYLDGQPKQREHEQQKRKSRRQITTQQKT
jgi:16S rRNA (adenine1518-N6/adenine1519-N6)-dimethyltransferase